MKFVRLTTDTSNGIFDCDFNDGITIPADAKIALQSASGNIIGGTLEITDANNNIKYNIDQDYTPTRQVFLTPFIYNNSNSQTLLKDITNKLNDDASYSQDLKYIGLEWNCFMRTSGKISTGYKISPTSEYYDFPTALQLSWNENKATAGQQGDGTHIFSRSLNTDSVARGINSGFASNIPLARGNGVMRVRIDNLQQTTTQLGQPIHMGFAKNAINVDTNVEANYTYGIRATIDIATGNRQYYTIQDGVETLSAVAPSAVVDGATTNDILAMEIDGDEIKFLVYKQGGNGIPENLLGATANPKYNNEFLYPFMTFAPRASLASFADLLWTPSAWEVPDIRLQQRTSTSTHLKAPPVNPSPIATTNNFIEFESSLVSGFLGYNFQRLPPVGTVPAKSTLAIVGQNIYSIGFNVNPYIVQLLNLKVDSYDSFKKQRENILAVIPSNDSAGNVSYSPPTPFFIDLLNEKPINVRNIKARIVNTDYSEVELTGQAILNILITK